ncbi:pseudouridine synthase [Comamonas sp. CMM03]|jgi:tRNA pseudouridine65 synthase|uniref:pseudouridine synthase n=1 Tax=Comamonas TaxID=283 RepID=UPI001C450BAC|nr:pseudouridine synthase [Comamonas sp. CMM03]
MPVPDVLPLLPTDLPLNDQPPHAAAGPELLHILHQDDDMVVVYKPAGWLVHRTALARHETRFVLQHLRDQIGRHVWPVHRLDQGTCGVLVFSLHKEATQKLTAAFAEHRAHKHYLALARGWVPGHINVDHALHPDDAPPDAPAQPAQTLLRGLARLDWPESYDPRHPSTRFSLVEAFPRTGRRHQIRRHLKHTAHPILGDATHGKGPLNRWWAERIGLQRLWLHGHALELPHPATGERMRFCADWRQLGHVPEVQQWQRLMALPGWQSGPNPLPPSCGMAL